jgi:hypothetical protein
MSALPPKADMVGRDCHVRFVPEADIDNELGNVHFCQKRTQDLLFDYLVDCGEQTLGSWRLITSLGGAK